MSHNSSPRTTSKRGQYLRKPSFMYRYVYHDLEILGTKQKPGMLQHDYSHCIDDSGVGKVATFRLEA
jgi:hypothetical protein